MRFKIAVGDWSDDGHGKCEYFMVETDAIDIGQIRDAYFQIKDMYNLDIGSIAKEYEESTIQTKVLELIKELGYNNIYEYIDEYENEITDPEFIADLVVFMINKVNPTLNCSLVTDDIPMLQFYGFDEKKRHLTVGGYGLFYV